MVAFCLGTSSEFSQQSQETESTHFPTSNDPREDGELNEYQEEEQEFRNRNTRGYSGRGSSRKKRQAVLGDQQSSGRKIAAKLYPLDKDSACEWQGKANCGGGDKPILGCLRGTQAARHHGPDKNVANNEEGNVHRICHSCHVRWHNANDTDYDWNATVYPAHTPRPMTEIEKKQAIMADLKYSASKMKKVED